MQAYPLVLDPSASNQRDAFCKESFRKTSMIQVISITKISVPIGSTGKNKTRSNKDKVKTKGSTKSKRMHIRKKTW